jgi:hypothetical protein
MSIRLTILILLIQLSINNATSAQEFNFEVRVNAPTLKIADPRTISTLEKSISEFYNNTKWSSDEYEIEEKIEGSIQINIKDDPSANSFVADIYITTGRPVYNSNYTSPILNHVDRDISFTYSELDPLRDNRSIFTDNLSSILTFYSYIILGFDYDTFSASGGEEYFKIANGIVANIPPNISSSDRNWSSLGSDRNRYWLINNILNPRLKRYRQAMYSYHRSGVDKMSSEAVIGKAVILSALKDMRLVNEDYPNSMVLQMFSNSKRAEILEIFKNSVKAEQKQVFDIMAAIDPAQSDFLKELR